MAESSEGTGGFGRRMSRVFSMFKKRGSALEKVRERGLAFRN